jgi:hypothetical protein
MHGGDEQANQRGRREFEQDGEWMQIRVRATLRQLVADRAGQARRAGRVTRRACQWSPAQTSAAQSAAAASANRSDRRGIGRRLPSAEL